MNVKEVRIQNQRDLIDVIQHGKLKDFIARNVGSVINEPLLPSEVIQYHPKYNPNEEYIRAIALTPLMFAIICERDDIVEYILKNLKPDLNYRHHFSNYTAFVMSALTIDCRCMNLFFKHQEKWVKEHINDNLSFFKSNNTTIIHLLTNRRDYMKLSKLLSVVDVQIVENSVESALEIAKHNKDEEAIQILDISNSRNESTTKNYIEAFDKAVSNETGTDEDESPEEEDDNEHATFNKLKQFAPGALRDLKSVKNKPTKDQVHTIIKTLESFLSEFTQEETDTKEEGGESHEKVEEKTHFEEIKTPLRCGICNKTGDLMPCTVCGKKFCEICMRKHISIHEPDT